MQLTAIITSLTIGSLADWVSQCSEFKSSATVSSTSGATLEEALQSGAEVLSRLGALRVDGVADKSECDILLNKLEEEFPKNKINPHMNVGIAIDDKVDGVMETSIERLYPLIKQIVGENGLVEELAFMINDPGATYQTWHADTVYTPKTAKMYSFFIALEDITIDMGPTEIAPGITSPEMVEECDTDMTKHKLSFCKNLISSVPNVGATMRAGDVLIMDSICQHRASENISDKRRRLFYYTIVSRKGKRPDGSTFTLIHPYKNKLQVADYTRWSDVRLPKRAPPKIIEEEDEDM